MALTLPDDTLQALRQMHPDMGWAIVKLLERAGNKGHGRGAASDVELQDIGRRQSLIVVNRAAMPALAGVQAIPWGESRAFLALDAGRSMADLELAVIDRLADRRLTARERRMLADFRERLAGWREDRSVHIRPKAIVVVEQPRVLRRKAGAA